MKLGCLNDKLSSSKLKIVIIWFEEFYNDIKLNEMENCANNNSK